MAIEPGQQLLHYRVVERIGEGGMGVVWKAVDTSLDREVAIKLLPQAFAQHADRLVRFEREAKLLASLNHPNIAAVYGLHRADTPAGELRFIAMEMVDGEDLAQRLARGPLPPSDALPIAAQIARGLSAAHEAGVIHRDLKPANVKLTADGKVKVLDFGLAKALDPTMQSGDVDLSRSPTVTSAGTMAGVILGTAAYMSPEQARGRPTDRRTDIWALGAVLYEMLSGRPPFAGETVSDIIARILERRPAWDVLPEPLHPGVRRLIERCLAKDPDERLRDAADVRLELSELAEDPTGRRSVRPEQPTPVPKKSSRWLHVLPWALLVAVTAWGIVSPLLQGTPAASPLVRFEINPPTGFQFGEFTTAPDGSAVAFIASNREATRSLWVRRLDTNEHRQIPGTEGAWFPFWSPDGKSVAFFAEGKLRRVDLASSAIQTIAETPNGRGGTWGADGTIVFTPEGNDLLYAVPETGGTPRPVTAYREPEQTHRFPHFVGDTNKFTYLAHDQDSSTTLRRYFASLDGDEPVVFDEGMSEVYAPPGYVLLVRETTLFAQRFDTEQAALIGEAYPLANNVDDVFPRTGRGAFSVSDNGVLMYIESRMVDTRIDVYDRSGRVLETVAPGDQRAAGRLSHDGKLVVFDRASGRESSVWYVDLERPAAANRLSGFTASDFNCSWAADDASVLCGVEGRIYRIALDDGEHELLLDAKDQEQGGSLIAMNDIDASRDGSFIVFSAWDPVTDFDLWSMPLDGDRQPRRLSDAPGFQGGPVVSPDGRWIAYESDESGRHEVYVRSPGAGDRKWLVSTEGGAAPIWSEDGRELFYVAADYGVMVVSVGASTTTFESGLPQRLFTGPLAVEERGERFFRLPDIVGIRNGNFLFSVPDEELRDRTIHVVLNWQALIDD